MLAPVRAVPESEPELEPEQADRGEVPVVVVEEPVTPAPVRTRAGCAGEWVDTWLWELCREREEEAAADEAEEGLASGI
ncbi:hypothetical protein SAMN05444920_112343 [Nonomuraea solani]|uniref:Uncharacterized protein n=1 Tax=Nonomuraea solani TaxID=1144553 RepID=A0A1H6EQT3_9ACTN|nr:hypothetical protein SAMN05444920_112343 [Nonomuraea solani]